MGNMQLTQQTSLTYINAKSFGAAGNGVIDDTAAIQAAINASISGNNDGKGSVFFPPGNYLISSALTIISGTTLLGSGVYSVIIQTTTNQNGITAVDVDNVTIRDLCFAGTGSGTGVGLDFTIYNNIVTPDVLIDNVIVSNWGASGIYIATPVSVTMRNVQATGNGTYGIYLHGGDSTANQGVGTTLTGCNTLGNGTAGILLTFMSSTTLISCVVSDVIGISMNTCQGIVLSACGAISCTTNSYKFSSCTGVLAAGCWTRNGNGDEFYITSSSNQVTLLGCREISPNAGVSTFIKSDSATSYLYMNCTYSSTISTGGTGHILFASGSGNCTLGANLTLYGAFKLAQSSSAVAITNNYAIATASLGVSRVNPGGNVTGVTLSAGTSAGQTVAVVNESAYTITFAASSSNVADGSSDVIAAKSAAWFLWDSGTSLWYRS